MCHRAALLLVLATLLAPAQGVVAQGPLPVTPGQRIRVIFAAGQLEVVGSLVAQDAESIRVQPNADVLPLAVAQHDITSMERSAGTRGHAGAGAVLGLLIGGTAGAVAGSGCEDEWLCPGPGGGALLLGGSAAIVGALVGWAIRSERWEPVPAGGGGGVEVGLAPVGGRAALRVAIRF